MSSSEQEDSLQWGDGSGSMSEHGADGAADPDHELSFDYFGTAAEEHVVFGEQQQQQQQQDSSGDTSIVFQDCFHNEHSEEHEEQHPNGFFDAVRVGSVGGGGGTTHTSTSTSSTDTDNRKRVVRFLEDEEEEDLDASLDEVMGGGGGLFLGAGLLGVGAGGVGFLMTAEGTNEQDGSFNLFEQQQHPHDPSASQQPQSASDTSIGMLDVFGEEQQSSGNTSSSHSLMEKGTDNDNDNDDDGSTSTSHSDTSMDDEKEQEKQIRKTLLITVVGMGFLGLLGFGGKKIMSALNRGSSNEEEEVVGGAEEIMGEAADTATQAHEVAHLGGHIAGEGVAASSSSSSSQATVAAAQQASFNASANASSTNGFGMVGGVGNTTGAMNGAQYVLQLLLLLHYSCKCDFMLLVPQLFPNLLACHFYFV
jgi:hypothetical protein